MQRSVVCEPDGDPLSLQLELPSADCFADLMGEHGEQRDIVAQSDIAAGLRAAADAAR